MMLLAFPMYISVLSMDYQLSSSGTAVPAPSGASDYLEAKQDLETYIKLEILKQWIYGYFKTRNCQLSRILIKGLSMWRGPHVC